MTEIICCICCMVSLAVACKTIEKIFSYSGVSRQKRPQV